MGRERGARVRGVKEGRESEGCERVRGVRGARECGERGH